MPLMYGIPSIAEETQSWVMRPAGSLGTDAGLLAIPPGFMSAVASTQGDFASHSVSWATPHGDKPTTDTITALTAANTGQRLSTRIQRNGMRLFRWEVVNAGSAASVGIGFRYDDVMMQAGTLTDNGVTFSKITSSIRTPTPVAFGADGTTVGVVVGYPYPFTWVAFDVTTSETGTPTHLVQYSQNGTTWTTVPANVAYGDTITTSGAAWTTTNGDTSGSVHSFEWEPLPDWKPNVSLIGGELAGLYLLRFKTDANTTAALITGMELGKLQMVKEVASKGVYTHDLSGLTKGYADGLVAFFGSANGGNHVYAEWEPMTA